MDFKYSIIYSDRKSITIIIERDRSVVVRAPIKTSEECVKKIVKQKKFLIEKKINNSRKYIIPKPYKEFVSGESLMFLGKVYTLEIIKDEIGDFFFENKFYMNSKSANETNKLLKSWYSNQAKEKLIPRIKRFADQLGVVYNKILISDLKYRWGSCTPKSNLKFNWRIIKAPIGVIDYIIVHELVHLIEPNHTKEFWNIVSVQLPNYKKGKEWLVENGSLLELEFKK